MVDDYGDERISKRALNHYDVFMVTLDINIKIDVVILAVMNFRLLVDFVGKGGIFVTDRMGEKHLHSEELLIKVFVCVMADPINVHYVVENV